MFRRLIHWSKKKWASGESQDKIKVIGGLAGCILAIYFIIAVPIGFVSWLIAGFDLPDQAKQAIANNKEVWMTTLVNDDYDPNRPIYSAVTREVIEERIIYILDDENPVRIICPKFEDGWRTTNRTPLPITFSRQNDGITVNIETPYNRSIHLSQKTAKRLN